MAIVGSGVAAWIAQAASTATAGMIANRVLAGRGPIRRTQAAYAAIVRDRSTTGEWSNFQTPIVDPTNGTTLSSKNPALTRLTKDEFGTEIELQHYYAEEAMATSENDIDAFILIALICTGRKALDYDTMVYHVRQQDGPFNMDLKSIASTKVTGISDPYMRKDPDGVERVTRDLSGGLREGFAQDGGAGSEGGRTLITVPKSFIPIPEVLGYSDTGEPAGIWPTAEGDPRESRVGQ